MGLPGSGARSYKPSPRVQFPAGPLPAPLIIAILFTGNSQKWNIPAKFLKGLPCRSAQLVPYPDAECLPGKFGRFRETILLGIIHAYLHELPLGLARASRWPPSLSLHVLIVGQKNDKSIQEKT